MEGRSTRRWLHGDIFGHSDAVAAAWFLAPALTLLLLFTYLPALLSFCASLFDVPLVAGRPFTFVGAGNYLAIAFDPQVRGATGNTLVYCALMIGPSLALGLGLALLSSSVTRGRELVSTILFLPLTANLVAMAVVFRWIFAYRGGFANELLGLVGVGPLNFLGETSTALPTVALIGIWRSASFCMVLFLAGLTAIPVAIHEAAAMDGMRGWPKLRLVILPMLRPTVVLATVVATLQAVQLFDSIRIMTGGGPLGYTESILTMTWRIGFEFFRLGQASALACLLLIVLLVIGWVRRTAVMRGS